MNQVLPANAFRHLVDFLKRPLPSTASKPSWPYPLPEAEMITQYGLRRLTPDEMSWTAPSAGLGQAVADDVPSGGTPATPLAAAKLAEQQRHWRTAVLVNIHQHLHL